MKILAVSHEFPPIGGGGANACYYLTKGLATKGHEVTLITANYQNMPEQECLNGVLIFRVNSKRAHKEHCSFQEMLSYLGKALKVADRLQKENHFDICLVFFGIPSGPIGYFLKKKYKLPYIIRFGGGDIPGFQERFTKIYKMIAPSIKAIWKNADARIANSKGLKDMALSFYDKCEFQVICNGVDTETYYPKERSDDNEYRILFVSRLIERKGLQFFIPQLKEIQNKVDRNIKLIIVGDGPYRGELERVARENGVSQLVDFCGQIDKSQIVQYYQDADIFILPSQKEGMPNVVLEAMASGLPIVMTPCEGSEELINANGFIEFVDDFSNRIIQICGNQAEKCVMSRNSRNYAKRLFSWEQVINQYDLCIRNTVEK